ncbi:hypothetical protein RR46_02492 [Papilio xuthus]|uniref:Uncharacterized protein n=1 Tax=Papilio xuthus TaxID=66420 RepID=A0A194QIN8_PAPXU|nr:hypothetical protein RR46_02492 [Papilio xuthus]
MLTGSKRAGLSAITCMHVHLLRGSAGARDDVAACARASATLRSTTAVFLSRVVTTCFPAARGRGVRVQLKLAHYVTARYVALSSAFRLLTTLRFAKATCISCVKRIFVSSSDASITKY